ncbi:hypothetical protein [Enterococcus faecium]|uniref:DUF3221 domain-containing protein n=1 Tax=Enterococcus faecium TaxID=1352 RepID=A0A242BGH2_ENTFC|nr:hypothetical protein [Enterococcus faecium]OTN94595.1 hypothetical protein A5810_000838 [Enterococcus faecium]
MSNLFLFIIFASIVCFFIGLISLILNLMKNKNKKTSTIITIFSIIAFIVSVTGFEKTYNARTNNSNTGYEASSYESSNYQTSLEEKIEDSSSANSNSQTSNSDTSSFEGFINTKPDFSTFVEEYYKYEADGKASEVRSYLSGTPVTWSGTIIETMHSRIAVIADEKYNGTTWENLEDNLRPYVFFAKDIDQNKVSQFKNGDHVTVSGKITSGGSKIANAQWDIHTENISK